MGMTAVKTDVSRVPGLPGMFFFVIFFTTLMIIYELEQPQGLEA